MASAPGRPVTRLVAFWRSEQRTLRQGFVALLISTLAALVAGIMTSSIQGTLRLLPSLYILLPAATGMRGTIFGAIGGRLGTADATGLSRHRCTSRSWRAWRRRCSVCPRSRSWTS